MTLIYTFHYSNAISRDISKANGSKIKQSSKLGLFLIKESDKN